VASGRAARSGLKSRVTRLVQPVAVIPRPRRTSSNRSSRSVPEGNRDEPVQLYEQVASEIRRAIADVSLTRKMVLEIVASS